MQLEDHVGDIVRKARAMSGISLAATATVAGMSEAELTTMEASGEFTKKPNFGELAKTIGLHPGKLASIVNGWLPVKPNLDRWHKLRSFTTAGEGLTVNCFLVWDEATRHTALFDTGLDAKPILACMAAEGIVLQQIFTAHSHWDHIEALPEIRAAFPQAQLHSGSLKAPAPQRSQPGETVALGGLRISHRATPGHAEDGVTYLVGGWAENAPAVAVVGDAIFAGSIGRGNQSWELARQKVRDEILSLPLETLICPGHGPLTTVREEMEHNPFF